jgi:DNA-directed RNA polymerase specialized sigma24 family protein
MLPLTERRALWNERKNILPRIARQLWRRCKYRVQLDDIRQEAALALWQHACEATDAGDFARRAWHLTHGRAKRRVALDVTGQASGYDRPRDVWHLSWCEAAPAYGDDQWAALGRSPPMMERCLAAKLMHDPAERQIVFMYLAGCTYDEIGTAMGVSGAATFKRLERILARYRRACEGRP